MAKERTIGRTIQYTESQVAMIDAHLEDETFSEFVRRLIAAHLREQYGIEFPEMPPVGPPVGTRKVKA